MLRKSARGGRQVSCGERKLLCLARGLFCAPSGGQSTMVVCLFQSSRSEAAQIVQPMTVRPSEAKGLACSCSYISGTSCV